MELRYTSKGKKVALGRRSTLLLILAAASLPLAAQQVQPNMVRRQLNQPASPQTQPAVKTSRSVRAEATPTTKPTAGAAASLASSPASSPTPKPLAPARLASERRDPFSSLVGKDKVGTGLPDHLPAGKAGLLVATLRLDGVVQGPNGSIAIVSNPQQRVYFLREGDHLYDGQVTKIGSDAISFHQSGKDPFGKPVEREIDKRLYPLSGEQQ